MILNWREICNYYVFLTFTLHIIIRKPKYVLLIVIWKFFPVFASFSPLVWEKQVLDGKKPTLLRALELTPLNKKETHHV